MIYDAFISYRHTPLDMEFAKKVHTGLETYHVPAAVRKKTGKKRIERVFRDQEELPIGSDLNDNISAAIKESEYLIVICSPETPGSYWVNKEIETFIGLHDRHHVLAVLTDGEPEESFPKLLLNDENGNPVEPLAADVRGATAKERNKKFKTEILRLAAPVLGCTYDDLRQRHRERILKRNIMIASVAAGIIAAAGAAFGIYNAGVAKRMKKLADEKAVLADEKTLLAGEKSRLADEKTKLADEILAEYRDKQENQSRFYAEEAMMLLREGNREDAVLVAAAGLPSETNDRPLVAEAEYALAAALHVYDCGKDLGYDRILSHDLTVHDMSISHSLKYLTSIDSGNTVYVWDCSDWKLLLKLPAAVKDNNYLDEVVSAYTDQRGTVVVYEKYMVRYDFSGKETARFSFAEAVRRCVFSETGDTVFCIGRQRIDILKLSDFTLQYSYETMDGDMFSEKCALSKNGKLFAIAHYSSEDIPVDVSFINLTDPDMFSVVTIPVSEQHILGLTVTDKGNVAAVSTNNNFFTEGIHALTIDLFRAKDGELIYSKPVPNNIRNVMSFSLLIGSHSYGEKSDIMIAAEKDAYMFDEETGEMKAHTALADSSVTLIMTDNANTAFIGYSNGEIIRVNTEDGRILAGTIDTQIDMDQMCSFGNGIVLHSPMSNTLITIKYHKSEELTELPGLEAEAASAGTAKSSAYYALRDRYDTRNFHLYDAGGNPICSMRAEGTFTGSCFKENIFVMASYTGLRFIDPATKTDRSILFTEMGVDKSYTNCVFSENGRFAAVWGYNGIAVIDMETETCIYQMDDSGKLGAVSISGDGSKVIYYGTGIPLTVIEVATGAKKELNNPLLRQVSDCYNLRFLAADTSGRYAAMACSDGCLYVVSAENGDTAVTVPMHAKSVCFIGFTKDGSHIIVQDNDYSVRIYDIETGACLNKYDATARVNYFIESGRCIAVCDYYSVTLLDAESFGKLAYVSGAEAFLPADETFIITDGTDAWSIRYKDYKALLKEAERQFPGAELTKEKKVAYNVE